jgi:hypothetical protein
MGGAMDLVVGEAYATGSCCAAAKALPKLRLPFRLGEIFSVVLRKLRKEAGHE